MRPTGRGAAIVILMGCSAGTLAGCAGGDRFFTSSASGEGSGLGNLLAFNTTTPAAVPPAAPRKEDPLQCPTVEVLDGTSSLRGFGGTDQGNGDVRYQYSMGDIARECSKAGTEIAIKVGVEGRVLLGPVGKPGSFTVPVRIAIRRDSDQKAVASKLYQVPVTIAFGETQGAFTLVSDPITVPFIKANADEDYTILVGFDEHPATPAGTAPRGKRKGAPG